MEVDAARESAPKRPSLKERVENHIIIILASTFAAGAGTAWAVLNSVVVTPREYEIAQLKERLGRTDSKYQLPTNQSFGQSQTVSNQTPAIEKLSPVSLFIQGGFTSNNVQTNLQQLRSLRSLRQLTAFESGKGIDEVPTGTFLFVRLAYATIENKTWSPPSANRFRTHSGYFEVHQRLEAGRELVAFANAEKASELSRLDGERQQIATFFPAPTPEANTLVLVPFGRIERARARFINMSEQKECEVVDVTLR